MFLVRGWGGDGGEAVGEHVWGKAGFGVSDVLTQSSYEEGVGPCCCIVRHGGDIFQQEVSDPCAGRAGEDGCWKDSGPVSQRGQVGSGLSSDH